ncbi:MAG: hypothetical protein ABS92_08785 [Thiobacillus sp. SCN 63-374]|nr:MAG: hypothetical protein ABS92_08785 [Thiobacillus sp. SCN 63-374]
MARGIFERPETTFSFDQRAIGWILNDPANPLNQISQLIPAGAAILDVGAGNGILARLFQALDKSVEIDAVEPDLVAKEVAAPFYQSIFPGGLEAYLESCREREVRYDFIVLADVVEHMANPEPILRGLKSLLTPGGSVIVSTPNVAFASVRLALLNGCFDYVDSGILERTHLRFYTLKTLKLLFVAAGLYPSAQFHCLRNPLTSEISLDDLPLTPWTLAKIANDELSRVYQFLFVLQFEPCEITVKESLGTGGGYLPIAYIARRTSRTIRDVLRQVRALGSKQ